MSDTAELNLREIIAHIDQMQADAARKRQEIKLAPWAIALAGMTAGAAFFAAGAGYLTLILHLMGKI